MRYLDQNMPLELPLESSRILANVLRVENSFSMFEDLLLIVLLGGAISFFFSESHSCNCFCDKCCWRKLLHYEQGGRDMPQLSFLWPVIDLIGGQILL